MLEKEINPTMLFLIINTLWHNKNGKLTDLSKSRHYGYRQNPSFLYEGKIHKNIKSKKEFWQSTSI
jgi:hypothetical protein